MNARTLVTIACLLVGIGLAAWSLANGQLLLAIAGFALLFTFLYLVMEAANKAGKPKHEIKRAANSAWSMKDEPSADNAGRPGNESEVKR
jgi:hypothetical protein